MRGLLDLARAHYPSPALNTNKHKNHVIMKTFPVLRRQDDFEDDVEIVNYIHADGFEEAKKEFAKILAHGLVGEDYDEGLTYVSADDFIDGEEPDWFLESGLYFDLGGDPELILTETEIKTGVDELQIGCFIYKLVDLS